MPISADCPKCGKTYQVKDDFAGKKFRCKACEGVVSVPAAGGGSSGDPWDNLDLNSFGDQERDEDGNELEPLAAPRRRSKGKKKSRGGGMPGTVIVALVCESIIILLRGVGLIGSLVSLDICGGAINLLGLTLAGVAVFGYIQANNVIRWINVVLCGIGILFFLSCAGVLGIGGIAALQEANIPQEQLAMFQGIMGIVIAIMIAACCLYATILGCLLSPSARNYFDR